MKFSEKWLREWVDPALTSRQLQQQITMAGLEVDSAETPAPALAGVVCAKVLELEKHPTKSRLSVCQVDDGEHHQVVCGAANVSVGGIYPYARVGSQVPAGTIGAKKLAGIASTGMLCSAQDLGLEESSTGLLPLDDTAVPGQTKTEYLQLDDQVIELELTPNRGDCLSIRGLAREVATLNTMSFNEPSLSPVPPTIDDAISIRLEAGAACPRYVGRIIRGINARIKTPDWMREKLRRSGVRSLGPVVDVTNYVMLELGQPMHAFDLAKIDRGIVVRQARDGEALDLLNGKQINARQGSLLICDHNKPLALAGIMGGEHSAVSDDSVDILLESAFFTPHLLAGQPRHYNLYTDSSHRFERGVDCRLQKTAIERATELLLGIVGGSPGFVVEVCDESHLPKQEQVVLRAERITKVLGIEVAGSRVSDILTRLGMQIREQKKGRWLINPPGFRPDISLEVDLIEEIARVNGYEEIPARPALSNTGLRGQQEQVLSEERLVDVLLARGYSESVSYSFVESGMQQLLDPDQPAIALANPLSEEMAVMRTSLWPGLIKACQYNLRRQQDRVRLFEIALIYSGTVADINQRKHVAGIAAGSYVPEQWTANAAGLDFFQCKSDFEAILGLTGRAEEFIFNKARHKALHPGQTAQVFWQGELVGWIGGLAPHVLSALDIDSPVFVFDLDLSIFQLCRIPQYQDVTKFPLVRRDLAILVDEGLPAQLVAASIRDAAGQSLFSLDLFDVYTGKSVPKGKKSLAFALQLQHRERTLMEQEVDELVDRILAQLSKRHQATLRE